ncbi:MAG: glycosyltransferase family 4 protein [Coriobacteriia bacterium]|nr:glycosyltransferase family 4 protein [Coriobacteriia bacterium]
MIVTENHAWGGAGAYLREVIVAVRPLYERVVVAANRGGLDFGGLPEVIAEVGAEHADLSYLTETGVWNSVCRVSWKLTQAALWLLRRMDLVTLPLVCSRAVRKHRPDAVFCANHGHQRIHWAMIGVCGRRQIPVATYMLGMPDAFDSMKLRARPELDHRMWKVASFVMVNARAVGEAHGRERGLPSGKVVVVPNGISDLPVLDRPDRTRDRFRVGTLGRLALKKGVHHLVAAVAQAREKADDISLVIAGEGTELGRLTQQASQVGLDGAVEFCGFVPDEDAPRFLASLDAFVLPSLSEGLPFTVMEAMRAGLPIVASRVGGVPEMIEDGVTGLLVECGDEARLAEAIVRLRDDRALAERLGRGARARFEERYTLEVMHDGIRDAFVRGGLVPGPEDS